MATSPTSNPKEKEAIDLLLSADTPGIIADSLQVIYNLASVQFHALSADETAMLHAHFTSVHTFLCRLEAARE